MEAIEYRFDYLFQENIEKNRVTIDCFDSVNPKWNEENKQLKENINI